MRLVYRIVALALVVCGLAFAQATTGNIYGSVTSGGAPLANVTATLTSPALINPQVQVTGAQGLFQFTSLPVGMYTVTFKGKGFSTSVRQGVDIQAGFSADINLAMVKGDEKQVLVSSQTQLVDTRSTTTQSTTNAAAMANVGASRDIWSLMSITPGSAIVGTMDVGGSQAGTQRTFVSYGYGAATLNSGNVAGATTAQARSQLDGVNTTEGTNSAGMYYDYGSIREVRNATASNDASVPQPGQFLNAVVKQGADKVHGTAYMDYEHPDFQFKNITQAQREMGAGTGTRITKYQDYDGDLGGPIKKGKVWFFTGLRYMPMGNTVTGFPAEDPTTKNPPPFTTNLRNFTEKFTFRLSKNHRVTQFLTWADKKQPYRSAQSNQYTDATFNQWMGGWASNVRYEGTITPKFSTTASVNFWGYNWIDNFHEGSNCSSRPAGYCTEGAQSPRLYEVQSTNSAGSFPAHHFFRRRWNAQADGRYALDNWLGVNHELTFGYMWEREAYDQEAAGPLGQIMYWFNSPGLKDFSTPYRVSLENGPVRPKEFEQHQGAYVNDSIRIKKRAILAVGFRWDYYRTDEPANGIEAGAPFRGFYYGGEALPNGFSFPATNTSYQFPAQQVLRFPHLITPRVGLSVDVTGKANTFLKLHYGRYYFNPGAAFGASTVSPLTYVGTVPSAVITPLLGTAATFMWNNPTLAPFNLNQLGSYVSGAPASTATIVPGIKDPYMDESTIFLERQFTRTVSMRTGYVYRKVKESLQFSDIGRTYGMYTQLITAYDPGVDGTKGTSDDVGNLTVCCDLPKVGSATLPSSKMQVINSESPQIYSGFDFSLNKRMSKKFSVSGSYSWNSVHVAYNQTPNNPLQAYNNRENVSFWFMSYRGTYQAPFGISVAPTLRIMQGQPAYRQLPLTGLNQGTYNLMVGAVGAYRYDDITALDVRLQKAIKFKEKYTVSLLCDLYNVTNTNKNITYNTSTGRKSILLDGQTYNFALFGSPGGTGGIVGPRIARLGVHLDF